MEKSFAKNSHFRKRFLLRRKCSQSLRNTKEKKNASVYLLISKRVEIVTIE